MMDSSLQPGNAVASEATLASSCPGGSVGGSRTKLFSVSGTERQNRHAGRPCAASAGCSFVELCAPAAPASQALLQVGKCTERAHSVQPLNFCRHNQKYGHRCNLSTQTTRVSLHHRTAAKRGTTAGPSALNSGRAR